MRGTGITNLQASSITVVDQRRGNVSTNTGRGKSCPRGAKTSPTNLDSSSFRFGGSLNFVAKKREALRIDNENLKMAKRIVN